MLITSCILPYPLSVVEHNNGYVLPFIVLLALSYYFYMVRGCIITTPTPSSTSVLLLPTHSPAH